MKANLFSAILFVAPLVVSGCGGGGPADTPELGSVKGTVTVDGNPGANLMVSFAPEGGGRTSTGTTDTGGHYSLVYSPTEMGAKVGMHTVKVAKNVEMSEQDLADPNITLQKPDALAEMLAKWSKQVEVKSGSNTIDLQVGP